jgi:hypothetical protein
MDKKTKTVVDRITSERLLKEMNGENFKRYLDKCIAHTQQRGYETMFHVLRSPGQDEFYYPKKIHVGDTKSVGFYVERHSELIREFEKKYGKRPTIPRQDKNREKNVEELISFGERMIDYKKRLSEFLMKRGEDFEIEMEIPREKEEDYSFHFDDVYEFINIHTHPFHLEKGFFPQCYVTPSINDLKSLRGSKKRIDRGIEVRGGVDFGGYNIPLLANPLCLVIGTLETLGGYRLGLTSCFNSKTDDRILSEFGCELIAKESDIRTQFKGKTPQFVHERDFCYLKGYYKQKKRRVDFNVNSLDVLLEV